MKIAYARFLALACVLVSGCAGTPKLPEAFDVRRATVVAGSDETSIVINAFAGSKGRGAAAGGIMGAGAGLFAGTMACVTTGPFLFVPCLGIVVPSMTAAGAVGGAARGAYVSESADAVEAKRTMLTEALDSPSASQRLASLVEHKMRGGDTAQPPSAEQGLTSAESGWTLRVALTNLATVSSGSDKPYSLQASATLELVRAGDATPLSVKDYQALSPDKMTTAEWRANDDEPLRTSFDGLLADLATQILTDLQSAEGGRSPAGAAARAVAASGGPAAEGERPGSDPTNLFADKNGIKWVIVPTPPVDLRTAKNMCGALDTGDDRKYRLPTLGEFERLWASYKGDEQIAAFNKKDYSTSDEDPLTRAGYTKTFSFDNGTSDNLYAAYLACVGSE